MNQEQSPPRLSLKQGRTLEQLAREESQKNLDTPIEKRFFTELNNIFQNLLGSSLRRQFNYFQAPDQIEELLLQRLSNINESELLEYAIKILRKDIEARFFEEVIILSKVIESAEIFKTIRRVKGREIHFSCVRQLRYKYSKAGTYLYRSKEPIKSIFLIINGKVTLRNQPPKEDSIYEQDQTQTPLLSESKKQTQNIPSTMHYYENNSASDGIQNSNLAQKQNNQIYSKGMSIGNSQTLPIQESTARNQAYVLENSHLAYLDILSFKAILDESEMQNLQKEVNEFSEMNILRTVDVKLISTIYLRTTLITVNRNNCLSKEGENITFVFFIKDGEIKLNRKVMLQNNNHSDTSSNLKTPLINKPSSEFQLSKRKSVSFFDISLLSKGQSIGLEEFLTDRNTYSMTSIVQSTQATVYRISKQDLQIAFSQDEKGEAKMREYFTKTGGEYHKQRASILSSTNLIQKEILNLKKNDRQTQPEQPQRTNQENNNNHPHRSNLTINVSQDQIDSSTLKLQQKQQQQPLPSSPRNLEFILNALNSVKSKYQSRIIDRIQKDSRLHGQRYSENDLSSISAMVMRSRKSLEVNNSMTPGATSNNQYHQIQLSPKTSPMHSQREIEGKRSSISPPRRSQLSVLSNNNDTITISTTALTFTHSKPLHSPHSKNNLSLEDSTVVITQPINRSRVKGSSSLHQLNRPSNLSMASTFSTPFRFKIQNQIPTPTTSNNEISSFTQFNNDPTESMLQPSFPKIPRSTIEQLNQQDETILQQSRLSDSFYNNKSMNKNNRYQSPTSSIQLLPRLSEDILVECTSQADQTQFKSQQTLFKLPNFPVYNRNHTSRNIDPVATYSEQPSMLLPPYRVVDQAQIIQNSCTTSASTPIHRKQLSLEKMNNKVAASNFLPLKYHSKFLIEAKAQFLSSPYKDTLKRAKQTQSQRALFSKSPSKLNSQQAQQQLQQKQKNN